MSPPIRVVAGVLPGDLPGEVLVFRRGAGSSHAGRWEFPGGKVEPEETDAQALARELREELQLEVRVGSHLWTGSRSESPALEIAFYEATPVHGEVKLSVHDHYLSIDLRTHTALEWAEIDASFVQWLTDGSAIP